mgnify:CR=1 FL=1
MEAEWHRTAPRTKQLVADVGVLRKLLDYLVRYDAFSFYYLLMKLQVASSEQASPSLWSVPYHCVSLAFVVSPLSLNLCCISFLHRCNAAQVDVRGGEPNLQEGEGEGLPPRAGADSQARGSQKASIRR